MMGGGFLIADCNGRVIEPWLVDFHDRQQVAARSNRLQDLSTRRRLHREGVVVRALMTVAGRSGNIEQAAFRLGVESRDFPDEAARLAAEHGFGPDRLIAMKGLARSRGVELEVVLRAALRGTLREIVELPAVTGDGGGRG